MNRDRQNTSRWNWIVAMIVAVLVYACANRGYPEGGPKDLIGPVVIAELPASYSNNFQKKKVDIYFNEFIQLKEISEKFIFSPPLKKNPKVSLRGKYIQVSLVDTLKSNTTYSMDFGNAIVDNNEGNPLGFYRYVFSTGAVIDTMELAGYIVNAESNEPMLGVLVALYENIADSLPLLELPDYIARTDSSGLFRLTNLKNAAYRVVAIGDDNKDKKYTPESEIFAYLDTLTQTVVVPMVKSDTFKIVEKIVGKDTLTRDSIVTDDFLAYGPANLKLRVFQEKLTQLYMVSNERPERERLDFIFSIPGDNDLRIELFDTLSKEPLPRDWYFKEVNKGLDSIFFWIKDSMVYKKDTLNLVLTYLRTDSLRQNSYVSDTNRYVFKEKKKTEGKNKRKQEEESVKIEFLDIKVNVGGEMDLKGQLVFDFDRPIDKRGFSALKVFHKVDTLLHPYPFRLREDTLKERRMYVDADWKADNEYRLQLDSATLYNIYGRYNNKWEKSFKVKNEEAYGKVILDMKGVVGHTIVQLYKDDGSKSENGKRKFAVVREKTVTKDGEIVFELLNEGKYRFRAIIDANSNGVWDTGLYLKHRQPEEILYMPVEITIKRNFDIEQEFDLRKTVQ